MSMTVERNNLQKRLGEKLDMNDAKSIPVL
jgi:hypothetical protein